MKTIRLLVLAFVCLVPITGMNCFAQDTLQPNLIVGFSVSTLGFGFQAAKPLTPRSDVRGQFNFYSYDRNFLKDGANYSGTLHLRSVAFQYDYYVGGGFHVSGGAAIWNGNKGSATVSVPGGQAFTLGGTVYFSDPSSPINGPATASFKAFAPMATIGYGNLVSKGHVAYSIDTGVLFQGSPRTALSLAGNACSNVAGPIGGVIGSGAPICPSVATTAAIQSSIAAQQAKINDDLKPFRYYPLIQVMVGYKF